MATATERIPILVTKADKSRFAKKARAHGLTISEFARAAMQRFDPVEGEQEAALKTLLRQVHEGSRAAEKSLDQALAFCAESDARLRKLDEWLRDRGGG
jgi:hypothetical protein